MAQGFTGFGERLGRSGYFWRWLLIAVASASAARLASALRDDNLVSVITIAAFGLQFWLALVRLRDIGAPRWLAGLLVVPVANVLFLLFLFLAGSSQRTVDPQEHRPAEMLPERIGPKVATLPDDTGPKRIGRLGATVAVFAVSCTMSLASTIFFNLLTGLEVSVIFGGSFLIRNVLSGGVSALIALAIILPLRRIGPEHFWVGGIVVTILIVPPLTKGLIGILTYAVGDVQAAHTILTPNIVQWFYPLVHFPANLVLAIRSAVLLALIAWLWPAGEPKPRAIDF